MKPLHSYPDHRALLRDFYRELKVDQPDMNLGKFARKVGLSQSNLKMIWANKRNLTVSGILKVAQALRLSSSDTEFLEALVLKSQAGTAEEKAYYAKRLAVTKTASRVATVSVGSRQILSDPLLLPLAIYLVDHGEPKDLDAMAEVFGVSREGIRARIEKLKVLRLLSAKSGERLHFSFARFQHVFSQKLYMRKLLEKALVKLETDYETRESLFSSYVLNLAEEDIRSLQAEIKAVMERYMGRPVIVGSKRRIMQGCFQFFGASQPFTAPPGSNC